MQVCHNAMGLPQLTLEVGLLCAFLLCASNVGAQASISQGTSAVQKNPRIWEYIEEFLLSEAVRNQDKGELQLTLGIDSREGLGRNLTYKM